MKNRFAAYYELPESRISEIWADSLIVFDTNALLNLYRYNKATREEFVRLLKSYKSRLWLPYQVGKEFHRNREIVIKDTYDAYQKLNEELKIAIEGATKSKLDSYTRLQYIDKSKVQEAVQKCMEAISKDLTKQQEKHPDLSEKDTILETITKLYDGKIGEDFSMDALNTLYVEGEKRYAHSIPPGYCDAKSKKGAGNRALYGDLIVWAQTLHKCKQDGRNVIFITNDYKSDWWDTVKGEHSPRKELIQEFMDYTGKNILVYDSVRFLTYAQKYEKADVSQATIDEVEKVSDTISWLAKHNIASFYSSLLPKQWHMPATLFPHTIPLGFAGNQDYIVPYTKQYYTPSYLDMIKETEGYVNLSDYFDNAQHQYVDIFDGLEDTSKKILSLTSKKKDK